jgi:hypothetical protein
VTLRISPVDLKIAPRRMIKTIGYNGSVPDPLLRLLTMKHPIPRLFMGTACLFLPKSRPSGTTICVDLKGKAARLRERE